jgi:transcriptional regulator with XRE-family HTH domain
VNQPNQADVRNNNRQGFLQLLSEHHARSGLSLREVAQACDLDFTYVHRILSGSRRPRRDVIIALGFAYNLDLGEVDELLLLVGYPPVGRSASKEYHQSLYQN